MQNNIKFSSNFNFDMALNEIKTKKMNSEELNNEISLEGVRNLI